MAPRVSGFGGEIKAMVASPHELFVAADIPETAESGAFGDFPLELTTTSKKIKIMSLRQGADGRFNVHTLDEVTFGEIEALTVYTDTGSDTRYLVAAGRLNRDGTGADHVTTYRWLLPSRSAAPFIDAETMVAKTGTFETSIWHGGVPGTSKAFLKTVFWLQDIGSGNSEQIVVRYGLDGASPDTYKLGTLSLIHI